MTVKITIDCMGGDHGPAVTVPAAVSFVRSHPDAQLLLVGIESAIRAQLKKCKASGETRLTVVPATEVVEMDDSVEVALRRKKDSSMRVALNLVKDGQAQTCISAGNTGALMAVSRYVLKTLPGIERPAIAFAMPSQKGFTTVLDLGANGIVGGGIPIAVGVALSMKKQKRDAAVVSFFGDGANNEGAFHEALNMASIWKLPVVFVCENNRYGMSTSTERSSWVPGAWSARPGWPGWPAGCAAAAWIWARPT